MAKVAASFGDPQSAAKLDVDDELAAVRAAPSPPAYLTSLEIATFMPSISPPGPLLVVTQGPWISYQSPVSALCRVRFVAWHPDPDSAFDIATLIHARLLARAGDADVISYSADTAPARGRDPDFPDAPIAAFALRARMRSRPV